MKPLDQMSAEELKTEALLAVLNALGPGALSRFISENNLGSGDYTWDRGELLKDAKPVEELAEKRRRHEQT